MDSVLQQGIAAAKSGDKVGAFKLLTRATQDGTSSERAWLWLSSVVSTESECLFCLDNALRINSGNIPAKNKAGALRQKGVFPALPMPPDNTRPPSPIAPTQPAPQPAATNKPGLPSQQPQKSLQPSPQAIPVELPRTDEKSRQDLSGLYKFVATELAHKQLPQVIVKRLTDQGVTSAVASKIVAETVKSFKKLRGEKYRKQMTRGVLWTIGGIVITCGTIAFSSNLGGKYVLFYGAIIYGVIDFIAGLVGWLSNR